MAMMTVFGLLLYSFRTGLGIYYVGPVGTVGAVGR